MWITRKYEETLRALFRQFPVVVVTGARQVGKTSLVRRVFPSHSYVSLDVPSMAEQAEKSPETFIRSFAEPLIIDEVQYAPSLFRNLKVVIDQDKRPGRFLLTGSQTFTLMHGVSESLAGRCGVLSMLNLSARELQDSQQAFDEIEYIFKGGYPELYEKPEIDPHFWYGAYFSTYLERDVRSILNVGNLRDFDRFLRAAAMRTGQVLSYSDLARDVGVAPNTAKQWVSVLQASGQIVLLEPYHRNLGKRLVKSPKLYMADTGLAAFLMGFDSRESLLRHPIIGAVWENHVVMQIIKHYASKGKTVPLWFWRTGQGAEVDLLVEQGGRFVAVEAKFSEAPDATALKGLSALRKFYGDDSLAAAYVAARTPRSYPLSDTVQAVPGKLIDQFLEW
jgi:hypothetical protein